MFRFANPYYLYLLLLVLAIIALYLYSVKRQKKRLASFGNSEILKQLMPNVSYYRPHIKFGLMITAITLIIIALARPQFGSKISTEQKQGVEAMIAIDVSNSMLAQDISPSRLDYSKRMLSRLFDEMSDDKVGIIVFAGDAFIQLPITSDNVSAKIFLSNINTNLVPRQGTSIGAAIDLAISSFGDTKNDVGRVIIVLTDGEDHEEEAVKAATAAQQKGITVNVIGVGSPNGAPIPVPGTNNYWKDKSGNTVVTSLNEDMCKQIAAAGKGIYVRADKTNAAFRAISKQINTLQKGEITTQMYSEYDDRFYIFAWLALFLLLLDSILLNRKNKRLSRIKWF